MAKIKIKTNTAKTIQMIIFLMRGQETLESMKVVYETSSDIIDYSEIQAKCFEFLGSINVTYQTNIYAPDLNNLQQQIRLEPTHFFVVSELIQKMNSTLILIIKSVYEQLREDFQAQIDYLKQQFGQLRQMVEQLRPIKQNIEFLRKTSVTGVPLMLPAQSVMQKDYQHLQLDIAVLYSEPLYDDEKKKPTLPAVDFRSEISRLNIALQSSFKSSILMRCQIGTIQSLKNIIKFSKPKILHVICHGNSQGLLEFQDDSRNTLGVLQLVKTQQIKNLLKNYLQLLPQLVFVNSCHSQNIGKAFFQIGVKNVIMINSQDLISDEAAQIFSQNFYRNIFRGQTVMQSFLLAKKKVEINHVGGCCCSHGASQPHRPNCRWLKLQKKYIDAHKDYHVPPLKCECKMRNFNRHLATCDWARKVLFQINEDFRIPIQEGSSQCRFPVHITQFPDYFDKQKKELVICCCPVKGKKAHSQSNKFVIISKQEGKDPLFKILHNRDKPEITDLTPIQLMQAHEKSKAILGRQRQLFQFLKIVKQVNFTVAYGKTGTGLTTFAVKACTYMMQRRVFSFFFFIDLYDIKDQIVFRYKFNQITKFQYNGKTIDQTGIKNKKILILFDNCDDFINGSPDQFYKQIQTLLRQMPKCKIIITFKQETNKAFDEKKILCRKFELSPFQIKYAISYLNSKLKDKTDITVGYAQFRRLINQYPVLKIPKVIQSLSQSFSDSTKKLTEAEIQKNVKGIQISDTNKLTEEILNQLKQKSKQAFEFLIFVSQFSDGVSFQDLNMFSLYANRDMSVQLPVKKNWQQNYIMLYQKQNSRDLEQKLQAQYPRLVTTVSHVDNPAAFYELEKANIQFKKKVSETATSSDHNVSNQLDDIKAESYFIDKRGKGRFIVKRFIRDFVWNKYQNETTFQMKFLYVAYFSIILQMLFSILKDEKYIHEDLMTYSAVSNSGIFSLPTTLQTQYDNKRDLTKSTRVAKSFISDLDFVFVKNQQLIEKIKSTDPSTFIMNHRHDFLKVYDYKWSDVFNYFKSKNKSEQKVFLILLENLLVYIPTALKIAKAEDSLLRYVLRGSSKQLNKIRVVSKPDRCLKNELKVIFIEIGLNLEDKKELNQQYNRANDLIQQFKSKIGQTEIFQDITALYGQQIFNIDLLTDLSSVKLLTANDVYHLKNRKKQFQNGKDNFTLSPLVKAKQALLLSLIFMKFLKKNQAQKKIILKSQDGNELKTQLYQLCLHAAETFGQLQCIKLKLKANLTALQLLWETNDKFQSNSSESYSEIEKCLEKIIQCQKIYLDNENRLRGFTQFDNKIKQLKQQIKGKLWRTAAKRIIFMKAYPLATKQNYPIIKNLVRKKNNFRKQIENILRQEKLVQNLVSQRKISGMGSPALKSKETKLSEKTKKKLDISTKFQILTEQKIQEEARARCSIMYLTVDVKIQNDKVFFVCENQIMGEQLVQIDQQLAEAFNFQNILILILAGANTLYALDKISKLSPKPPIIISLNSDQVEHYDQINYSHDVDQESIRELVRKQNQIKESELNYTKIFINLITQTQIQKQEQILEIHKKAEEKLKASKGVKAIIHLSSCSKSIYLKYNEGVYRDLSPGYERNHNIDQKYYENNVLVRRWKKMLEFFKYLNAHRSRNINRSSSADENTDLFNSMLGSEGTWPQNQTTAYINIYGENGCGKTFFIREIAKILVQRQFYDFGVFLFQGKKIENYFGGDFEAYIKKQASLSRMPNLEDFHRLLSEKTILIVDDFHLIKPRTNARMKLFMDRVLSRKVNLILVSTNQLKLQFLQKLKKIKLQVLDVFETEVLAYNILNVNNPQQILAYSRLKQNNRKRNRGVLIKEIQECKRARLSLQPLIQDLDTLQQNESQLMKKSNTTFG